MRRPSPSRRCSCPSEAFQGLVLPRYIPVQRAIYAPLFLVVPLYVMSLGDGPLGGGRVGEAPRCSTSSEAKGP